jgi:hypothetical protein
LVNSSNLDLPFDQYQRYGALAMAADWLRARLGRPLSVLDCGDWNGLAERFCSGDRCVWLDPTGHGSGRYVQADGEKLPFQDGAFDLVACLDTLEHVEGARRPAVIAELRRVARYAVVLAAPRADDGASAAERALYDYVWDVLGGEQQQLKEHLERGLPSSAEMRLWLEAPGWHVADAPSGLLADWRTMMLAKHILLRTRDGDDVHRALDRRYNERHGAIDHAEPAYRHVLFAGRDEAKDMPAALLAELPPRRGASDGCDVEVAMTVLLGAHARRAGGDADLMAPLRGEGDAAYRASRGLNHAVRALEGAPVPPRPAPPSVRGLVRSAFRRGVGMVRRRAT